jgi:TfoX/Sxy family transcriptional regulator of competence genes
MAYDAGLAGRLRGVMPDGVHVVEKRMFGGLAFMLDGHMACGVIGGDLMVRIGPERAELALGQPHVRPMDFTGKPLKGYVYVAPGGLATDDALRGWVTQAAEFVASLPPK